MHAVYAIMYIYAGICVFLLLVFSGAARSFRFLSALLLVTLFCFAFVCFMLGALVVSFDYASIDLNQ